jgi:hypothetical protein
VQFAISSNTSRIRISIEEGKRQVWNIYEIRWTTVEVIVKVLKNLSSDFAVDCEGVGEEVSTGEQTSRHVVERSNWVGTMI